MSPSLWSRQLTAIAALLAGFGCGSEAPDPCADDPELCEGAPEILQVFVRERIDPAAPPPWRLAFGNHPAAAPDDDGSVFDAVTKQAEMHVILDQPLDAGSLVRGNGLANDSARVLCQGDDVPVDFETSSYRAAANQAAASADELPAVLGPAIVVRVEDALRTSAECELRFPGVIDSEGMAIFNVAEPFFYTEGLLLLDASPAPGSIDVSVDVEIFARFNAPIATTHTHYIELRDGSDNVATGTERVADDPFAVELLPPAGGLAHATTYRVVMRPGMEDIHGGVLADEASFTFTTSPTTGE